jgi:hypothetical protein
MKKKVLLKVGAIILALALCLGLAVPALAATSATVTITATPTYIAMTNSEASWAVGTVAVSSTYWWTSDDLAPEEPFVDGDMKSTITNTGSVAEDIDIKVANFTGGDGWTISTDDSPEEGEISLRAGITGTANEGAMVQMITSDSELVDNLASSGTKKWCMEMETPSSFTDGAEKTGTVTLTASAYD